MTKADAKDALIVALEENIRLRAECEHRSRRLLSEEDVKRVAKQVAEYLAEDHGLVGIAGAVGAIIESACSSTRAGGKP
jgi:regulator of replication initiation timing